MIKNKSNKSNLKNIINLLKLVLGVLIIYYLVSKIGVQTIKDTFISMHPTYLILIILSYIVSFTLGGLNLRLLLTPLKHKATLLDLTKFNIISWAVGMVSPGKIGEFTQVVFLKKKGVPYDRGFALSIIDKVITFIVFALIATAGFFIFLTTQKAITLTILTILFSIFLVYILAFSYPANLIIKILPKKLRNITTKYHSSIKYYFINQKKLLFLNALYTLAKLFIMSIVIWFAFKGFDWDVNLFLILVVNATSIIISLIPITISGLGISQAILVYLFSLVGIPESISISVAILLLIINYGIAFLSIILFKMEK